MDALVQDALSNVWSVPDPQSQVIIKPGRLTANGGVTRVAQVGLTKLSLPDTTSTWYLYQVGQLHPMMLNLFTVKDQWHLVSDSCNEEQAACNIYNDFGIEAPRTQTYYRLMSDRNLVFAVKKNSRMDINLDTDSVYVRVYRNAYFQSGYTNVSTQFTVAGGMMASSNDIIALQAQVESIRANPNYAGGLICYVNGRQVESISVATAVVGDVAEYCYDSSVYKVAEFAVQDLRSFTSTMDNKAKWLLHYADGWGGTIDHCFNVDMYLVDKTTNKGVYVHKNAADTLRMVTFKDYAVTSSYVKAYFPKFANATTGNISLSSLYLRLYIRYDGNAQQPKEDANKTNYLLKLSSAQQLSAMVGASASNPVWRADNLEASFYNQLMVAKYEDVNSLLVEKAYGYSACNSLLATNVVAVSQGQSDLVQDTKPDGQYLTKTTNAATAAYSTRKLNPGYSGPCLRVRRSSDDAEVDVGFTAQYQLDEAALLAFVGASHGFVSQWYDQSGLGQHAVQINPGWQPAIVTAGVVNKLSNRPALSFRQGPFANYTMYLTIPGQTVHSPIGFSAVYNLVSQTGFGAVLGGNGAALELQVNGTATKVNSAYVGTMINYGHAAIAETVVTGWVNPTQSVLMVNDQTITGSGSTYTNPVTRIGQLEGYLGDEVQGLVAEVVLYAGEFTDTDRVSLHGDAYPYYVTNTTVTATIGKAVVDVAFQSGATAYEYDAAGLLTGFFSVTPNDATYDCASDDTRLVEFISGSGSGSLSEALNGLSLAVPAGHHYRCYERVGTTWQDATASNATTYTDGVVAWRETSTNQRLLRSDQTHLAYEVSLSPTDGVLMHSVSRLVAGVSSVMPVPMGEYDFWLNGHPLVEGVDYFFNFPLVQVVTKKHLYNQPAAQKLTVRCFGLCTSALKPVKQTDIGYVFDGALSVNDVYNLHDGKTLRVSADGALLGADKQAFVESVNHGNLRNGAPYEIRELCNSMAGLLTSDPYALRQSDLLVEQKVKDYLSLKIPTPTQHALNPITEKYPLYSPFLSKVIWAIQTGAISAQAIAGAYSDNEVRAVVAGYTYLLQGDPVNVLNTPDLTYCVIHPHWLLDPITLTANQYRFLANVTRVYAKDKVELATLVHIA